MVDVVKGQKIWIELEATKDMCRDDQIDMWKIYGGKTKIDSFETTSIIWNKDYFSNNTKEELTKKLLDLNLLDTNMLTNIVCNDGGFNN